MGPEARVLRKQRRRAGNGHLNRGEALKVPGVWLRLSGPWEGGTRRQIMAP